jgi:hypothetical protein
MPENCKNFAERLLIVEGKDDCHSIYHVAQQNGCETLFGIWEGGNDEGALKRFGGLLVAPASQRPKILGIVLDSAMPQKSDTRSNDLTRRWAQIQDRLRDFKFAVPEKPSPVGTIIRGPEGFPKIGIWLMPDNQTEGMLEDFLLKLVPRNAAAYAKTCAQSAKNQGHGNYKECHEAKAVAHTYLAWQDEPGKPLGLAIKSRLFDTNSEYATDFIAWLKGLFEAPN